MFNETTFADVLAAQSAAIHRQAPKARQCRECGATHYLTAPACGKCRAEAEAKMWKELGYSE